MLELTKKILPTNVLAYFGAAGDKKVFIKMSTRTAKKNLEPSLESGLTCVPSLTSQYTQYNIVILKLLVK